MRVFHIGRSLRMLAIWTVSFAALLGFGAEEPTGDDAKKSGAEKQKTVAEIREASDVVDGFFTLLRDREDGKLHLVVRPDQLDQEFIFHTHVVDGVAELGLFRGNYGGGRIFELRRHFDRLEIVEENTSFYFDAESPLRRAQQANVTPSILATQKIVAEDDDAIVIGLDEVVLKEHLQQIKPTPNPNAKPGERFALGKLSASRSKVISAKSYPQNTEIVVEYVYENVAPVQRGEEDITNARAVSIQVQLSFVAMPDADYDPRIDDYRVGYFTNRVTDLTSDGHAPYRDLINRWRLVKKDPAAAISDPVEPITFWIENTTPLEFRDTIRAAALRWNTAFEKAGFSNALAIETQPDDAEWDAGDIRYNVLRWTSSPRPPFGGMGPSFTNPRTGEILGADIMLEFSFVANLARTQELLQPAAHPGFDATRHCALGTMMQSHFQFARFALDVQGVDDELQDQLFEDALSMLILHEIGHTLGLNHNMKASQLNADPFDPVAVAANGLSGSVMDYEAVNVAPPGRDQTLFYQSRPGPYDDWAIEFGYSSALPDADAEAERLDAILARSGERELVFGNDADDMRSPGRGIDPRINTWDLGADAIGYALMRMEHVREIYDSMLDRYDHYETWQPLRNGYGRLVGQWGQAARVIAGYVGGVYVTRLPPGSGAMPYEPVPLEEQQRAMDALAEHVFAGDVFADADVLRRLQPQRRGFDFARSPEDPPLHQQVLAMQQRVLDFLLNPVALQRMTNTRLYGNEYDVASMLNDLSDAIFIDDLRDDVSTQRQNLQVEYVSRLADLLNAEKGADHVARSSVHYQLERVRDWMARRRGGNLETQAHGGHVLFLAEKALAIDE